MLQKQRKPLATIGRRKATCKVCECKFTKTRSIQPTCTKIECSIEYVKRLRVAKACAPYREKPRSPKKSSNERGHQLSLTQDAFNAFIRWRDRDLPCISSGATSTAQWDAGHYIAVGNSKGGSLLRFDENNCHKQTCEQNNHKGGACLGYRPELIKRIGIDEVIRLESTSGIKKWDIDELKEMRARYRKIVRDGQKGL